MEENFEVSSFVSKAREAGNSLEITIPEHVVSYEGLSKGDLVKVIIKKLPKKED